MNQNIQSVASSQFNSVLTCDGQVGQINQKLYQSTDQM